MLLILYSLPPIREMELKLGKKFIYRPKTRADFDVDKDILVEYRAQYTWRLFLGTFALSPLPAAFSFLHASSRETRARMRCVGVLA